MINDDLLQSSYVRKHCRQNGIKYEGIGNSSPILSVPLEYIKVDGSKAAPFGKVAKGLLSLCAVALALLAVAGIAGQINGMPFALPLVFLAIAAYIIYIVMNPKQNAIFSYHYIEDQLGVTVLHEEDLYDLLDGYEGNDGPIEADIAKAVQRHKAVRMDPYRPPFADGAIDNIVAACKADLADKYKRDDILEALVGILPQDYSQVVGEFSKGMGPAIIYKTKDGKVHVGMLMTRSSDSTTADMYNMDRYHGWNDYMDYMIGNGFIVNARALTPGPGAAKTMTQNQHTGTNAPVPTAPAISSAPSVPIQPIPSPPTSPRPMDPSMPDVQTPSSMQSPRQPFNAGYQEPAMPDFPGGQTNPQMYGRVPTDANYAGTDAYPSMQGGAYQESAYQQSGYGPAELAAPVEQRIQQYGQTAQPSYEDSHGAYYGNAGNDVFNEDPTYDGFMDDMGNTPMSPSQAWSPQQSPAPSQDSSLPTQNATMQDSAIAAPRGHRSLRDVRQKQNVQRRVQPSSESTSSQTVSGPWDNRTPLPQQTSASPQQQDVLPLPSYDDGLPLSTQDLQETSTDDGLGEDCYKGYMSL